MATSSPSSPSPPQLSSTLPLDLTSPVRIVQKQVLQVRGHARGCTVALFMRLALPTSSSKSRSFPLFPDEGVKLKSSAVYPVAMAKGGRSTVIPPDASNGLKRAAQALALTTTSTAGEEQRTVTTPTTSKQVKPRITSANFHITLVCPPLPDGGATAADRPSPSAKSHYVAVVQLDVALALSLPRWPFEARIPIPRCLNNKLQFLTSDDEDGDTDDSDTADRFTVEFEPPLVQRPRPRKSDVSGDASMLNTLDSESGAANDDVVDDCAASGPFPSSELMVARWAYAQAGASKVHGDGPALSAGRYPVLATALQSDAQILHVERCDDEDGRSGGIWVSLRVHLTLHDFHYAGLDKTAALYLAIKGGGQWQPETLSVRSERAKLLHSWSIDGRQESLMSRSSSVSTLAQTEVVSTSANATPSLVANGSSMLFDSSLSDDTSNLIDTQPPKGVADVLVDGALDDIDLASTPTTSVSITPLPPVRRPSAASLHSMASEYSQKSSALEHGVLCLLLRTAGLRDAAEESEQLSFSVHGRMRIQASPNVDADGTEVRFSCPFVVATHVETRATLCSVSDAAIVMDLSTGSATETPVELGQASSGFEVVSAVKSEHGRNSLLEDSVDMSSSTVAPQRSFALHDQTLLRSSDESLSLACLVPQQSAPQHDVASWMGVVEEASVKVWISNNGARGSRRAVNRLRMTWPRAWPGVRRATSSSTSALLPTLVVTLPRLCKQERIEVLHASIHGEPLSVVSDSSKEAIALSATTSEGATSTSVQFRMPNGLYGAAEGEVYVVLLYSVEGGERDAPHCLFAPVASMLNYLHVELFDEAIKTDGAVAIASFSDQPAASSSLRVDKRMGTAVLDASELPAMSKVTLEYVAQTTALVPLDVVGGAPMRRHSLTVAATAKESDTLAAARLEPKLPSRPARLSWTTIVLIAQSLALAALLLHVSLSVLPATRVATHKIDRIAEALDLDVGAAAWQATYRWAKQPQTGAEYAAGDRSLVVRQHTGLATVDPPLLRVAAAWLSLVLTWPYRVVSLLLRR